jgi:tryptophan-rich hypothetical protein
MTAQNTRRLNPKKLLLSKWTAVMPRDKEMHFIVTKLIPAELPAAPSACVEIEAIYSRRIFEIPWRDLNDASRWLQGWV